MKKAIITVAVLAAIGVAGMNLAEAGWGGGRMMGGAAFGPGYCNGPGPGGANGRNSFSYEEMEKFRNETAAQRGVIFEKRNEYFEVMNQENPDKERAQQLWSELFDLQNEMHQKALEAGVTTDN